MYGYLVGVVIVKNVGGPAFSMQSYYKKVKCGKI